MKHTKLIYTLSEFYDNWDININPQNNNDVLIIVNESNEVVKVLQNGNNIMI